MSINAAVILTTRMPKIFIREIMAKVVQALSDSSTTTAIGNLHQYVSTHLLRMLANDVLRVEVSRQRIQRKTKQEQRIDDPESLLMRSLF
jgi:hypothetical protein